MVIVTELLPGMSLRKYLGSVRPDQLNIHAAINYALDIARAMDCLHANGIIHRDLKPGMAGLKLYSFACSQFGYKVMSSFVMCFLTEFVACLKNYFFEDYLTVTSPTTVLLSSFSPSFFCIYIPIENIKISINFTCLSSGGINLCTTMLHGL